MYNLYALSKNQQKKLIIEAIKEASGIKLEEYSEEGFLLCQVKDGKFYELFLNDVVEVFRSKTGEKATQVNLKEGRKILLTSDWIGFPPYTFSPVLEELTAKVVTTFDLKTLIDCMESKLQKATSSEHELHLLDGLFFSVLKGGEQVGFDCSKERRYFKKIVEARSEFL